MATGRRINGRDGLIACAPCALRRGDAVSIAATLWSTRLTHRYFGLILQLVEAIRHHDFARLHSTSRPIAYPSRIDNRYRTGLNGVASRVYNIHVGGVVVSLQRCRGTIFTSCKVLTSKRAFTNSFGNRRLSAFVKIRAHFHRPGTGIDLVVERQQCSLRQQSAVVTCICVDFQVCDPRAFAQLLRQCDLPPSEKSR